jgi:hypothetical protein
VESAQTVRKLVGPFGAEHPNHRHGWLLRPRRERPRGRSTAEKRDELAPFPLMEKHPTPNEPKERGVR